jgi:uncharacterized glyoxalase superfamily protein PhnB
MRAMNGASGHVSGSTGFSKSRQPAGGHDRRVSDATEFLGVTAYLRYPDGDAAAEWLSRVLGFGPVDPRRVKRDSDGRWQEGELVIGPTRIDISATGGAEPEFGAAALHIVAVRDVDAQYERIRQAGGELDPPKDEPYGPRSCNITDPWGYRWYFWQGDAVYPAAEPS